MEQLGDLVVLRFDLGVVMHVLIIEDDLLLALDVEDCLLGLLACTTDLASTEHYACKSATDRRPDLIVSDVRLADGDGLRAVRWIKDALGAIPVVYVTANPERARSEDPDAPAVAKPFGHEELANAIGRALGAELNSDAKSSS